MKNASSYRGTVFLICLGLALLAVAAFAVLGGEQAAVEVFSPRAGVPASAEPPMPDGEINVNTADMETLMRLPGVGGTIAAEIIREREANGPFHYPEDLMAVKGIGEKKMEGMLPFIRLDIHTKP